MEVMAAEFPDIYQQFMEPPTFDTADTGEDTGTSGINWNMFSSDISKSKNIAHDSNENMKFEILTEQNSGQHLKITASQSPLSSMNMVHMTGSSITNSIKDLGGCVPTTGLQSDVNFAKRKAEESCFVDTETSAELTEFADLDDILTLLEEREENPSTNSQLGIAKSAFGCQWSDFSSCLHGDSCPFIKHFLGLAELQEPVVAQTQPPRVHSVVVLKQTPTGLVKLRESLLPLGQEEVKRLQSMTPEEQVQHLGLNTAQLRQENKQMTTISSSSSTLQLREQVGQFMQPSVTQYSVPVSNKSTGYSSVPYFNNTISQYTTLPASNIRFRSSGSVPYRPPPNAVLVKVPTTSVLQTQSSYQFNIPTPSPSPPTNSAMSPPSTKYPLLCSECDTQFHDSKSLVKHTRNQHQMYQCNKCGEETVGYYRMATHTKKNHSKEPAFFCQCGRNFSEKRGLTKHQNSCSFFNPH